MHGCYTSLLLWLLACSQWTTILSESITNRATRARSFTSITISCLILLDNKLLHEDVQLFNQLLGVVGTDTFLVTITGRYEWDPGPESSKETLTGSMEKQTYWLDGGHPVG